MGLLPGALSSAGEIYANLNEIASFIFNFFCFFVSKYFCKLTESLLFSDFHDEVLFCEARGMGAHGVNYRFLSFCCGGGVIAAWTRKQ